jgi:hypothetical protein
MPSSVKRTLLRVGFMDVRGDGLFQIFPGTHTHDEMSAIAMDSVDSRERLPGPKTVTTLMSLLDASR